MEEQALDEEELWNGLEKALNGAIDQFVETRTLEGENLKKDILEKLSGMLELVGYIEERAPRIIAEYREKLEEERSKVVEKAQAEARAIIEEARAASDLALSELKEIKKRQDKLDWQQVNDSRAEARRAAQRGGAEHRRSCQRDGAPAAHPSRRGRRHGGAGEDGHQGHGFVGEQGTAPFNSRQGF